MWPVGRANLTESHGLSSMERQSVTQISSDVCRVHFEQESLS